MKYHCKDKDSKTLSIHRSIEEAHRAMLVWNHTRELVWIADQTGRLLTADEVFQALANAWAADWVKGVR